MPARVELHVDQRQLAVLQRNLKEAADKGLTRELRKGLRAAAKPLADAERAAARGLPARGQKSSGLRDRMAAAVTVRYSSSKRNPGVRVHIPKRKMPPKEKNLPRHTQSPQGWRHPVYGNREVWVQQVMAPGWWMDAARPHWGNARREINAAVDRVAQQITRGT